MIRCIIIEDEPLARGLLEAYINKVSNFDLIATFETPIPALNFLRQQSADVIFCDIEMPDLSGLNFLKILTKKPIIILTTAYSEYAIDAFALGVSDYLLKPITFERFLLSVERVNTLLQATQTNENEAFKSQEFIFIKDGQKHLKVILAEIIYIKSDDDYIHIVGTEKKLTLYERLKNIASQLPNSQFIRIHNSYIVNLNYITKIHKNKVEINGIELPISEKYKNELNDLLK